MNIADNDGVNALMMATQENHVNVVKLLLEKQAEVNARNTKYRTVLMIAAYKGHVECARLLLDHGAEVINNIFLYLQPASKQYGKVMQIHCAVYHWVPRYVWHT